MDMDAGLLFRVANSVAMIGWLLMAVAPRHKVTDWVVFKGILPIGLAALYAIIVATTLGQADGSFSTLAGVKKLFTSDWAMLAGWVHYLVFDMFVGSWILRDSWRREIPHLAMIPLLFATLMLGPVGYLLYKIIAYFRPIQAEAEAV